MIPPLSCDICDPPPPGCQVGDLFEAVLSQTFTEPCPAPPSELFRRTRVRNPAPFGFLMNLGAREYLVGASPEMYVRVQAQRVETCPISGTIKRGGDAIADAGQILELLSVRRPFTPSFVYSNPPPPPPPTHTAASPSPRR